MLEHEKHENEQVDFFIKVLGSFQSSMTRQVKERVRIKRSKADGEDDDDEELRMLMLMMILAMMIREAIH